MHCFTTSWDDGHPLDIRLAELLASHGCKGTFYVPSPSSGMEVMTPAEIRRVQDLGMEIGAHTISHSALTQLDSPRVRQELLGGKEWLEDIVGSPVSAFCFPRGKFNSRVCRIVEQCGYRVARTTVAFRTDPDFQPSAMPVSFQFLPHPRTIHVRHGLREGNATGLFRWASRWSFESDLERLSAGMMQHVSRSEGIVHIWGHSWELERYGLWPSLNRCLKLLNEFSSLQRMTNSGVLDLME
jgi:peptidoglycan/xylan/chitin deacetylase (PgdA/CDA1 family)